MSSSSSPPQAKRVSSARSPACPRHWRHEIDRLIRLYDRVTATADGPVQGLALETPQGYGSVRLLDNVGSVLSSRADFPPVRLSPWPDGIHDWPSLAMEILAQAHASGAPHGSPRETLLELRSEYGDVAFRATLDDRLVSDLRRHGGLLLLIPGLDRLLGTMNDADHWSFRNVLQTQFVSVITTVKPGWNPDSEQAFLDFFRRTQVHPLGDAGLRELSQLYRLSKTNGSKLAALAKEDLEGRPALVEAAAAALAKQPGASREDVLREVAWNHAPFLHERIAKLSPGARRVLAYVAYLAPPVTSGALAEVTRLSSGAVATQLGRLVKAGILRAEPIGKRTRAFAFDDPVLGKLHRALVWRR